MDKNTVRTVVRSFYSIQKLRIEVGNRLVASIRVRLGQDPGTKTEEMPEEAKKLLEEVAVEYKRVTDGLVTEESFSKILRAAKRQGTLVYSSEKELARLYTMLKEEESRLEKLLEAMVSQHPLWDAFLKDVRGCGPLMAAVILSEFDIYKARYPSSFWKYAGLDVAPDGRGRGRYPEHLVKVKYINSKGEEAEKLSITFNPFLKTKLIGVLGPSFLRAGGYYAQIYRDYRHRLDTHPAHKDKTKAHKHAMAVRYMVKMFLLDLWLAWRELEGLPLTLPYHTAKLGIVHSGAVKIG